MTNPKLFFVILALILGVAIAGYAYYGRLESSGAVLLPADSADRLLGRGIWRFNCRFPVGHAEQEFVGLQIRRMKLTDQLNPPNTIVSVAGADELLTTAGIGMKFALSDGFVAIQLVDLPQDNAETDSEPGLMFQGVLRKGGRHRS